MKRYVLKKVEVKRKSKEIMIFDDKLKKNI